jgi:hypothetical protein
LVSRKGRDERVEDCLGDKVGDHERVENCIMSSLRVRYIQYKERYSIPEHATVSKCVMDREGKSKYNVL